MQITSLLLARKSFWDVNNTLEGSGFLTTPYHAYVQSFGEWCYVIATYKPCTTPKNYPADLKYVSYETAGKILRFPADISIVSTKIQRLNDQALVRYCVKEWSEYLIY